MLVFTIAEYRRRWILKCNRMGNSWGNSVYRICLMLIVLRIKSWENNAMFDWSLRIYITLPNESKTRHCFQQWRENSLCGIHDNRIAIKFPNKSWFLIIYGFIVASMDRNIKQGYVLQNVILWNNINRCVFFIIFLLNGTKSEL